MPQNTPAVLVFEDGKRFRGRSYGVVGRTTGQGVFVTAMTGYQEILTDPVRAGQIVVMTTPHIGNVGTNDDDARSEQITVSGLVVRDPARIVSNFRATRSLDDDLASAGVVAVAGVDTRAVTRHLRDHGPLVGAIFAGDDVELSVEQQREIIASAAESSSAHQQKEA